jgi:hypothetical protein
MVSKLSSETTRVLRHLVATIAFRASRSLRDVPDTLAGFRPTESAMTAKELVCHMTNVMAFAVSALTQTERVRHEPVAWSQEIERFYSLIEAVDKALAGGAVVEEGMELRLLQGPLADVLTHVGQLHTMRRQAGFPVSPTNYIKADVRIGRVALHDQASA